MIYLKRYLVILITLFIVGCSSEEPVTPQKSVITPAPAQKAEENKVTITPDNATAQSVITLNADSSMLVDATIDWYVNGNLVESAGIKNFASSGIEKGDIIQTIVTRNKKEYYSNEITIMNSPPRIKRAEMIPALPRVGAVPRIKVDAHDIDGDTIYYKYKWILNDKYISDQNYLDTKFKRDDMIVVEITPYDSAGAGSTTFIKNKIYNSSPVLTESDPSFDGKTYTYQIDATDVDGDKLVYEILEGPEGMAVDTYGLITWEVSPEDEGRHEFKIFIDDNNGSTLIVPITTSISFK